MITDSSEFTPLVSFASSGVVTTDTFNDWRKKNNGVVQQLNLYAANSASSGIDVNNTTGSITIKTGGVTNANLAGSITGDKLANLTVTVGKLAGGITADKLAGGITNAQLAGSITGDKLVNLTITTDKIAAGAITYDKIAVGAVYGDRIPSNAITTDKIINLAVTNDKLAGSITNDKLTNLTITGAKIAALTITNDKLVDINGSKIVNNSITGDKLTAGAVGTTNIANGAVTAEKLSGAQTGVAPVYGPRAWVTFDATTYANLVGTYSRSSSTTVAVTIANHGLLASNIAFLDFTMTAGGAAPFDGVYLVTGVTDSNTFTVISSTTTTSSGNVTLVRKTILASGNVTSVIPIYNNVTAAMLPPTANNTADAGQHMINFGITMPDTNYAISCSAVLHTSVNDLHFDSDYLALVNGRPNNTQSAFIGGKKVGGGTTTATNYQYNSVMILR